MQIQLIYDGKALTNNEINPRDLAKAVLSIEALLYQANAILNKDKAEIHTKVKASFETGCFKINFEVSQGLLNSIIDLLNSPQSTAIVNSAELLGIIALLIAFLKKLQGKKPQKLYENEDGTFSVEIDGKKYIEEKKTIELYQSYKVRQAFEDLVSPLKDEGIEDLALKTQKDDKAFIIIKKNEVEYFETPKEETTRISDPVVFKTNISLISLAFDEKRKWYINDGQSSFYATIEDETYIKLIDTSAVSFSKGDVLTVEIRKEQLLIISNGKLKIDNYIQKVLKHTPAKKVTQLSLLD